MTSAKHIPFLIKQLLFPWKFLLGKETGRNKERKERKKKKNIIIIMHD